MPLAVQSDHQTEGTAQQTIAGMVILIKCIAVPALVLKSSTCIGVTKGKLGSGTGIVAAAVDTVRSVCTVPGSPTIFGNVIIIERSRIVISAFRLIGHQTNDRSLFDENRVRLTGLIRVVGEVELRRSHDALMYLPVCLVCARCIFSFFEHPDLVGGVVAVITENIHIR